MTKYCARCTVRVGKEGFVESEYKIYKYKGRKFTLCKSCYKDVEDIKYEYQFSKPDRDNGWYKRL